ncbi:MAG: enoyl-CoA hydratase/isomerase family protein, partial [Propionicimonas sp.]|nr:enoyl-CoA hydratase/isomerase family protein [Propionicimonas sp.]
MDGSGDIGLTVEGHVACLTLSRPKKLNAMTPRMADRLYEAVVAINRNRDVRSVVLSGEGGRAFSVGSDINALDQYPQAWDFHNRMQDYPRSVRALRAPVVCAITGYCLG